MVVVVVQASRRGRAAGLRCYGRNAGAGAAVKGTGRCTTTGRPGDRATRRPGKAAPPNFRLTRAPRTGRGRGPAVVVVVVVQASRRGRRQRNWPIVLHLARLDMVDIVDHHKALCYGRHR